LPAAWPQSTKAPWIRLCKEWRRFQILRSRSSCRKSRRCRSEIGEEEMRSLPDLGHLLLLSAFAILTNEV
jgi:hypothetical protein